MRLFACSLASTLLAAALPAATPGLAHPPGATHAPPAASAQAEEDLAAAIKPARLKPGVVRLHVANLHCKSCARKLARKLYTTPGVLRVRTYVGKNMAVVEVRPKRRVELARLWRAAELAEQQPIALLVRDKKLVAKDLAEALRVLREELAQAGAARAPRR
ncbi:MAG: heavy-metal-associated domain-containing protein [Planctomycetota bacterium]